jgi:hypothetical protein
MSVTGIKQVTMETAGKFTGFVGGLLGKDEKATFEMMGLAGAGQGNEYAANMGTAVGLKTKIGQNHGQLAFAPSTREEEAFKKDAEKLSSRGHFNRGVQSGNQAGTTLRNNVGKALKSALSPPKPAGA